MAKLVEKSIGINKVLILVVNYNLNLKKSKTFQQLKKCESNLKNNYTIILWDNLPKQENLKIFEKNLREIEKNYLPSLKNESLAEIYNTIIMEYRNKYSYFILLDNDSNISKEYFIEFEEIIKQEKNINLILPKILYENKVFSPQKNFPSKLKKSIFYNFEEFGIKTSEDVMAVNSGMIISSEYLKKSEFLYDKRLKFYGTDNYFMYIFRKNIKQYYLMKYVLEHDFSMGNTEKIEKALWRHKDILNGDFVLLENYLGCEKIVYILKILKNSILKMIKYKSTMFLKFFLKKCIKNKNGEQSVCL